MSRIIISIHGLNNKPSPKILKSWWLYSIFEGFKKRGIQYKYIPFEMVYWADVLHEHPLNPLIKDPDHPDIVPWPYMPSTNQKTRKPSRWKKKWLSLIEKEMDFLLLNKYDFFHLSTLAEKIVYHLYEELELYYTKSKIIKKKAIPIKTLLTERLYRVLKKHQGKEICLLSHSMGSIIAYDVLSELKKDIWIRTWITFGSPLGQPIILKKSSEKLTMRTQRSPSIKVHQKNKSLLIQTPESVLHQWINLSDLKDRVAMNYNLHDDYEANKRDIRVRDKIVCNDYQYKGKSNHHNSFGYLRTPEMALELYKFLMETKPNFWENIKNHIGNWNLTN